MELELASRLLFALVVGHGAHAVSEAYGVRLKLRRSEAFEVGRPAPPAGVVIRTKAGALLVGIALVAALAAIAFAAATWLHASSTRLLEAACALLVVVELTTTALYDGYHRRMDALGERLRARSAARASSEPGEPRLRAE